MGAQKQKRLEERRAYLATRRQHAIQIYYRGLQKFYGFLPLRQFALAQRMRRDEAHGQWLYTTQRRMLLHWKKVYAARQAACFQAAILYERLVVQRRYFVPWKAVRRDGMTLPILM